MNGMELSEAFYRATCDRLFAPPFDSLVGKVAVGLAGEGSECFGFDDEASRDHDWGPGYCIWLDEHTCQAVGAQLQQRYERIAAEGFAGLEAKQTRFFGEVGQRVGVFSNEGFFAGLTRGAVFPDSHEVWFALSESGLAAAVNGKLFDEGDGSFLELRNRYLAYYPEDVRLKKLAGACLRAAQAGQYNFPRQENRGEHVAAFQALAQFLREATAAAYALNRQYLIFYKWAHRGLRALPCIGSGLASLQDEIVHSYRSGRVHKTAELIEQACVLIVDELRNQGLSSATDPFLVEQAVQVNYRIEDEALRAADIMRY